MKQETKRHSSSTYVNNELTKFIFAARKLSSVRLQQGVQDGS